MKAGRTGTFCPDAPWFVVSWVVACFPDISSGTFPATIEQMPKALSREREAGPVDADGAPAPQGQARRVRPAGSAPQGQAQRDQPSAISTSNNTAPAAAGPMISQAHRTLGRPCDPTAFARASHSSRRSAMT